MSSDKPQPVTNETPVPAARKPYTPPALVEYGSVARLTQGGGATVLTDSGSMMRM
jgi:hypothetical protein